MATVGSQLTAPESGWKRIDNTEPLINYIGNFTHAKGGSSTSTNYYNGSLSYLPANLSADEISSTNINFYFVGTALRIISLHFDQYTSQLSVTVDGVSKVVDTRIGSTALYQVLTHEFLDLEDTIHFVTIKSLDGIRYGLDAIDINEGGFICNVGYGSDNVSYLNASFTYLLPMNTTSKIKAKRNDSRVGLLGTANDGNNFGDLYIVGYDGKSHLTKSAYKYDIIFEGILNTVDATSKLLSKLDTYRQLIVTGGYIRASDGMLEQLDNVIIYVDDIVYETTDYNLFCINISINDIGRRIFFTFTDDSTIKISNIINTGDGQLAITRIQGIY